MRLGYIERKLSEHLRLEFQLAPLAYLSSKMFQRIQNKIPALVVQSLSEPDKVSALQNDCSY
jgi:hypothetical protein